MFMGRARCRIVGMLILRELFWFFSFFFFFL